MIEQAVAMARKLVSGGVDSTVACIRAADHYGVQSQSVINAYMWA